MGQYYKVIFLGDKPEKEGQDEEIQAFSEPAIGYKLMEHSYQNHKFMKAIESLLIPQGAFYKTRLVWAGDYAKEESGSSNLFRLAEEAIQHDSFPLYKTYYPEDFPFLVNHTKKEYVDKQTISNFLFCKDDKELHQINPLSLLTAEGNGQGRGDYEGIHMELVGRWARDSISVEKTPPSNFTKLKCDFLEEHVIPVKHIEQKRTPKLILVKDLLEKYNFDISKIIFKNPDPMPKFISNPQTLIVQECGPMGMLVFYTVNSSHPELGLTFGGFPFENCCEYSQVLDMFIDLDTFYEDPLPYCLIEAPRQDPKEIAESIYKEIEYLNNPKLKIKNNIRYIDNSS